MKDVFTVARIEGEYAYITEDESGEELFIAMALLPSDIDVGTKLIRDGFELKVLQ
jgi:hypothetical protein